MKALTVNTAWFRDRIVDRKTSQRKLAKALKLDPAAVSLMLRGKRGVSPKEAEAIAIELGVPIADVLENMGINATAGSEATALVRGVVTGGGKVDLGRQPGVRKVPVPTGMPEGTQVLRGMSEGYTDGWLFYYAPMGSGIGECLGRLCVVQLVGKNEWYLRVLRHGARRGTYTLVDVLTNGERLEDARVASAAPVAWVKTGA